MSNLLHYHCWDDIILGHGLAAKLRRCSTCGREETFMFDRTKHAFVWTPGNFMEDDRSPVFIVAGNHESWLKNAQVINETYGKETEVIRVAGEANLDLMLSLITPRIFLAEDWFLSDLIENPKLRAILMYR